MALSLHGLSVVHNLYDFFNLAFQMTYVVTPPYFSWFIIHLSLKQTCCFSHTLLIYCILKEPFRLMCSLNRVSCYLSLRWLGQPNSPCPSTNLHASWCGRMESTLGCFYTLWTGFPMPVSLAHFSAVHFSLTGLANSVGLAPWDICVAEVSISLHAQVCPNHQGMHARKLLLLVIEGG